jgi:hypothetical protein
VNLKKAVAQAAIATVLAGSAAGAGVVPATADPDWHDWDQDEWVDNAWHDQDWNKWRDQDWIRWNDHDWDKWWRVNKWRNDDSPPWGWGPPPAVHWRGHPPDWIDYWGFRVHPIWDPHFHVFGFWLFGIFIPVFVVW